MGRHNYLIEGLSGSGKTTVAEALERRGHHVVHGDRSLVYLGDPETGQALPRPRGLSPELATQWLQDHWIWPLEQVTGLIADPSHPATFFCGGARNFHHFTGLMTKVFVLDIDLATLTRRLAKRPPDEFGGRPEELALILRLHATGQGIPPHATRIDASAPIESVLNQILSHCLPLAPNP